MSKIQTQTAEAPLEKLPGDYPEGSAMVLLGEGDKGELLRWLKDEGQVVTCFANGTPESRKVIAAAIGTPGAKTRDVVNKELSVIGWAFHFAELAKPEGEIVRLPRFVLLCEDGLTVSTTSGGCIRYIRYLARQRPAGPWNPPVRLVIESHDAGEGKSYCDMRELEPMGSGAKGKSGK